MFDQGIVRETLYQKPSIRDFRVSLVGTRFETFASLAGEIKGCEVIYTCC